MENHTYPPPAASAILHYRLITKYLLLLPGQQAISRDAALLAGLAALHDLDEIVTRHVDARLDDWRNRHHDQTATISDLENALDDAVRRIETHRASAELWRTQYDISQTQLNAVETECARLKTLTNASSSPTTAPMALSEPAASNTSKPPAPTPPSPAASSTASAATAAPASSAPTSNRRKSRITNHESRVTEEVGDTTGLDPTPAPSGRLTIDWPTALAGLLTPEQITYLEIGTTRWYQLPPETQSLLVMRIAATINQQLGTISQSIYQDHKPHWATSVGSWVATCPLTWRQVLDNLGVQPSFLLKSKRIVNSATQP